MNLVLSRATAISGMPTLPAGHVVLMAFSWLSMILYVCIIWTIIRWRKYVYFLRSSYYYLLVLQAFIDFHMFLTVELIMRPRKFNFFNLFSSHMLIYAKFTYMNLFVSNTAFAFCHLFIALNRLTAFYSPLLHNKVGCAFFETFIGLLFFTLTSDPSLYWPSFLQLPCIKPLSLCHVLKHVPPVSDP
ncbi:unnamed protein product [Heligmosomoides polygyrus]|uniref:G protein-coupled receptor n=1 Tax=Heligmosomoides polygyrus TaxID=6339 RepID=A0A183FK84_HELPZ|nr:unnamed protein product [Heligmosomoides polygyrus]